jgi:hypothetical protein
MVARSAFTQLRYSTVLLLGVTLAMPVVLVAPPVALVTALLDVDAHGVSTLVPLAASAWLAMSAAYWPVIRFYRLWAMWTLALPVSAALFLAMTWGSAFAYWRGTRATWKNRRYASNT